MRVFPAEAGEWGRRWPGSQSGQAKVRLCLPRTPREIDQSHAERFRGRGVLGEPARAELSFNPELCYLPRSPRRLAGRNSRTA
jgi:hypothetical protein